MQNPSFLLRTDRLTPRPDGSIELVLILTPSPSKEAPSPATAQKAAPRKRADTLKAVTDAN
jgi:hypothetical protein